MAGSTIADSLQDAARTLAGHSDSPRLDAELLLCGLMGVSRPGLIVRGADAIAALTRTAYEELLERRVHGAPVAYLTGTREFWSLTLTVTTDVLVPRPETELLVEQALALLPADPAPPAARHVPAVLDLGTGSGAIALAIASERPHARVTGVEVSAKALAVAQHNAAALGLSQIVWRLGSWFAAVAGERFDVIIANPPYIAAADPALRLLAAEPALALTPGATGLEALSLIIDGAAAHLNPRGWLLLEHGSGQGADVASLLERRGFDGIRTLCDFSARPRVSVATPRSLRHSSH